MQFGVLITDHGKHSDEKLAITCAQDIIQIGASASGQQAVDGRKLENKIVEVLEGIFLQIADFEHGEIDDKGTAHLSSEMVAHPEIFASAVSGIMDAIAASPLAPWFNNNDTRANVTKAVDTWMKNAHDMHRDWFAQHGKVGHHLALVDHDKHDPDCEHVKRWKAARIA